MNDRKKRLSRKSNRELAEAIARMNRAGRRNSDEALELRRRQRAERKARLRARLKANPRLVTFHFKKVA